MRIIKTMQDIIILRYTEVLPALQSEEALQLRICLQMHISILKIVLFIIIQI
ncbi:hypothetical protein [Paenibacillus sp. SI8]|uniref:hypothetical protein n=1 Tax=unclassified Paenibacillus TaxID=185978 RepID=UPI0034665BD3